MMNPNDIWIEGAIPPGKIADFIAQQQAKTTIGAYDIFLGQVRADIVNGQPVTAIGYSAYEAMALQAFQDIEAAAYKRFDLIHLEIYHSLGQVKAGEICLFVAVTSAHRKAAMEACRFVVEAIKADVPVFGKEIFEDQSHQWKVNR